MGQDLVLMFWYFPPDRVTEIDPMHEMHLGEVKVLICRPAPDERWLRSLHIDVLKQDAGNRLWLRHSLSDSALLVHVASGLLVDGLELFLRRDVPFENVLLEARDGVVCAAHALDLLAGTVGGTGVGHGVASVPVGDILEHEGSVAGIRPLLAVLNGGLDSEAVHAVDLETGNVLSTLVVVRQGRGTGRGGTHTILVVCERWSALVEDIGQV